MKRIRKIILSLLLVIAVLVSAICFYAYNSLKPASNSGSSTFFVIENGSVAKDVISNLADNGIIKDGTIGYLYARIARNADFKAGSFDVPGGLSTSEVFAYLSDSNNIIQDTVSITFIEGDWLKDFAKKLSNNTNLSYEELMNYWKDEQVLNDLISKYDFLTDEILADNIRYPLEGYFFPDTYEFFRTTTPEAVTRKMLDNTNSIYSKYLAQFTSSNLSFHQILTLASIVQYEGVKLEDMKGIASVFYNRLAIGMKLQSSVTVCYSLDLSEDDNWTKCEFNNDYDSPYNTYLHEGLTPGPIVSPGENAVRAVLEPDTTDYYYFIGDVCGDGSVHFAKTFEEHNQNIKEYLWCY